MKHFSQFLDKFERFSAMVKDGQTDRHFSFKDPHMGKIPLEFGLLQVQIQKGNFLMIREACLTLLSFSTLTKKNPHLVLEWILTFDYLPRPASFGKNI